jgi:micrococcal nuclease
MLPKLNLLQLLGFGLLLFGVLALWVPKSIPSSSSLPVGAVAQADKPTCMVLRVYDGDTLGCDVNTNGHIDGKAEHVRLLGIDAPEMAYSRKNTTGQHQYMAEDAKTWLEQQAMGQRIVLEQDTTPTDKYGRILAYIYLPQQTESLNAGLLKQGLARLRFMGANRRYQAAYTQALQTAQHQKQGLWQ